MENERVADALRNIITHTAKIKHGEIDSQFNMLLDSFQLTQFLLNPESNNLKDEIFDISLLKSSEISEIILLCQRYLMIVHVFRRYIKKNIFNSTFSKHEVNLCHAEISSDRQNPSGKNTLLNSDSRSCDSATGCPKKPDTNTESRLNVLKLNENEPLTGGPKKVLNLDITNKDVNHTLVEIHCNNVWQLYHRREGFTSPREQYVEYRNTLLPTKVTWLLFSIFQYGDKMPKRCNVLMGITNLGLSAASLTGLSGAPDPTPSDNTGCYKFLLRRKNTGGTNKVFSLLTSDDELWKLSNIRMTILDNLTFNVARNIETSLPFCVTAEDMTENANRDRMNICIIWTTSTSQQFVQLKCQDPFFIELFFSQYKEKMVYDTMSAPSRWCDNIMDWAKAKHISHTTLALCLEDSSLDISTFAIAYETEYAGSARVFSDKFKWSVKMAISLRKFIDNGEPPKIPTELIYSYNDEEVDDEDGEGDCGDDDDAGGDNHSAELTMAGEKDCQRCTCFSPGAAKCSI